MAYAACGDNNAADCGQMSRANSHCSLHKQQAERLRSTHHAFDEVHLRTAVGLGAWRAEAVHKELDKVAVD